MLLFRCLEFEIQSTVEYAKQLLLSTILQICKKLSKDNKLSEVPKQLIQVEIIVQCIRASQNPQTHHHALLLLVEVAALVPVSKFFNKKIKYTLVIFNIFM